MSFHFKCKNKPQKGLFLEDKDLEKVVVERFNQAKRYVFVGWRFTGHGHHVWQEIHEKWPEKDIFLIEIFKKNCDDLERMEVPFVKVILGDVRKYREIFQPKKGDFLVWQHGPEHISLEEAEKTVGEMKEDFDAIFLETPYGSYPQGAMYGNIHETHISLWKEGEYHNLGFRTSRTTETYIAGYWEKH